MTDGTGNFVINGLRTGQRYNLFTNFYDPNTQTQMNGSSSTVTAPATGVDITISQPTRIRVAATLTQPPTIPLYGSVNVHDSSYLQNGWGSLRVQAGSTTSDNGDSFNPSTWTVLV